MKKFKIVEEVLDTSWHRYYYEVPANTKEEAVEMVKEGDVDCYDSEELFEFGQQYIDPMDNNGEPTREIYDDEWHLMWQNAQIVNYGQLITNSLQNIKKYLFHLMEAEPESFSGGNIPLGLVKEVMETLGWVVSDEIDTNGWDVDYWIYATKEGKDFKYMISGNLYYSYLSISKEKL